MTAALLKQAREALKRGLVMATDTTSAEIYKEAITALDAHAALSEYDKAVHALAPYLPVWVEEIRWINGRLWMHGRLSSLAGHEIHDDLETFNIPAPPEGDNGLRRIVHNQDGTTVVEG